jgi:hypothetical protein
MHGARERNSIRWEAHRALLDKKIEQLQRELARVAGDAARAAALRQQLEEAERRRATLGPSPHAKMG